MLFINKKRLKSLVFGVVGRVLFARFKTVCVCVHRASFPLFNICLSSRTFSLPIFISEAEKELYFDLIPSRFRAQGKEDDVEKEKQEEEGG